jgi:hypothetical protein
MRVCILTLSYPACNAHAQHDTDICGLSGGILKFSRFSHERHDIWGEGRITGHTFFLIFSLTFFCNVSHSNKKSARYYHKCTSCKVPVVLVHILTNLQLFSRVSREKSSNTEFHENESSWSMRTGEQTRRSYD